MLAAHKRVNFSRLLPAKISITRQVTFVFCSSQTTKITPLLNHSIMLYFLKKRRTRLTAADKWNTIYI